MQSNGRRDAIAASIQVVADVLSSILFRSREMGDSPFPEESRSDLLQLSRPNMKSEERRLRTFQDWPDGAPVSPADLAAAGFFFTGPDDRVQCFCCGGALYDWFAEDDPIAEHKKYFPTCSFIQGQNVGNQQIRSTMVTQDCMDGQFLAMLQTLSMEEAIVDTPTEYPDVETEYGRLTTFENWPAYARVSPGSLARAGFFYKGSDDYVQCFSCDGSLRNWDRGDDPWVEHARWFPRCQFLLQSRGRDFVNSIQESYLDSSESNISQPEDSPVQPEASVETLDINSPRINSMVQRVLQMGFTLNSVKRLVQSKFRQTGVRYQSMSELVLDLLQAVQEQGSQTVDTGEPSQQRPAPSRTRRELEDHSEPAPSRTRRELEQQSEPAPSRTRRELEDQSEPTPAANVEEQLRRLKEERMCKVCMDKDVSILLVPCGHLVVCAECVPNLRRCPICRAAIRDSMKAFLS